MEDFTDVEEIDSEKITYIHANVHDNICDLTKDGITAVSEVNNLTFLEIFVMFSGSNKSFLSGLSNVDIFNAERNFTINSNSRITNS